MSVKITGIGIGLPERIVTNAELSGIVDTSDEWISTRTGIKQRRIATKETLLELATTAANEALGNSGTSADSVDLIICATLQGDNITPSLACTVQNRIGAHCPAFDVNAACCGFIFALDIAKNFIIGSKYKKILIVCADMLSRHVDWTDRSKCVLFGDVSSACVVEPGEGLEYINLTTTGEDKVFHHRMPNGNCPFRPADAGEHIYMNGQEVYKFALGAAREELRKCLKTLDLKPENIDNFVLHQANKRIIDAVRESLNLPEEKFPVNIDKYGNTSAASILLLLYELERDGKIKKGDKLFMAAFGGGLTSASCLMNWKI